MPTPHEWPDEVDLLFDEGPADELGHVRHPDSLDFPPRPDAPFSGPVDDGADSIFGDDPAAGDAAAAKPDSWRIAPLRRPKPEHPVAVDTVDTMDAALFGRAAPSETTADVQQDFTLPDIARLEEHDATVERDGAAAAALAPLVVDDEELAFGVGEDETAVGADEPVDEDGASKADGDGRGRRRVLVAATVVGLVVMGAATLGVLAFTGSDDPRPAVNTDREVTTTTAAATTTTAAATTTTAPPPPPETAAPAADPPATSAPTRRTPTTTRSSLPPAPAATQPAPPPPPPPPEPPPTNPPPPSTTTPPTT